MKKNAQMIAPMLLLVAVIGCHTQTNQQPANAKISQQSERTIVAKRDLVLAYYGSNPGPGWEQKQAFNGHNYWERHVTVNVDVSKHGQGPSECSLSLSQLGTLPSEKVYMEINAIGIGHGDTQANMPTTSGPTLMLIVNPQKKVMSWTEFIKE